MVHGSDAAPCVPRVVMSWGCCPFRAPGRAGAEGSFVENDARVWAYDGDRNLWMLEVTRAGRATHGPTRFPCRVPTEVLERLSVPARQALK